MTDDDDDDDDKKCNDMSALLEELLKLTKEVWVAMAFRVGLLLWNLPESHLGEAESASFLPLKPKTAATWNYTNKYRYNQNLMMVMKEQAPARQYLIQLLCQRLAALGMRNS